MMQIDKKHLMAQQAIMQARGMYNGKIDGIWGPKTIAAKQKWERSGKFAPAIPNNGFPLDDRSKLPAGITRMADGTLTCDELLSACVPNAGLTPVTQSVAEVATPEAAPVVEQLPKIQQNQNQNQNQQNRNQNQNQNQNQNRNQK